MSNLLRCVVLFAILCVSPPPAAADTFYDTYQRGLAAFKAKNYADARAEFLRAYDLRSEPVILFNVAQTYRLEQRPDQALIYYKRFLGESEIAEDLRNTARAYVAGLEAGQAARDSQAKIDADAGPKERDGAPVRMPAPPMDRSAVPSSTMHPSDTTSNSADAETRSSEALSSTRRENGPDPTREKSEPVSLSDRGSRQRPAAHPPVLDRAGASAQTSRKVMTISIGAGAVALLGGGLGFESWAQSRYAAAKSEMMSQSRRESLYDSANTRHHAAQALAMTGLAAGVAAVWLYLRDDSREPGATNNANMHIVPAAGGITVAGEF